jgi:hypothetical protein
VNDLQEEVTRGNVRSEFEHATLRNTGFRDRLAQKGGQERMSKRTHLNGTITHRTLPRFGAKESERS